MDRRRRIYYLLLNVLVSACVTSAILFWYDRNYRALMRPTGSQASSGSGSVVSATVGPVSDSAVQISSVIGAGTLNAEVVIVKFTGEGQLDLAGWQLKDDDGNTFSFPEVTLYTNGAVQVHTAAGTDTVIDLHWAAGQPVWQSGEDARLFDSQGTLVALYRVP